LIEQLAAYQDSAVGDALNYTVNRGATRSNDHYIIPLIEIFDGLTQASLLVCSPSPQHPDLLC
jgi:hypothetical protein